MELVPRGAEFLTRGAENRLDIQRRYGPLTPLAVALQLLSHCHKQNKITAAPVGPAYTEDTTKHATFRHRLKKPLTKALVLQPR